jgi:double-stranded uracil-DNA glycosylase
MPVQSFPPIAAPDANRLILGTMPGITSLRAGEYYAHPRNAFWPIVESLLGVPRSLPYAQRVAALAATRVAVWDVLAACTRTGSLDSDIVAESIVANDLPEFLARHPGIGLICFNGAAAGRLFERHVLGRLSPQQQRIARTVLPSTSPANARLDAAAKCAAWHALR